MGLDARRVYALATGIAFLVVAVAGGVPGDADHRRAVGRPLLLLFAFEAVIIGGMGSFWGTFLGALVLGLTQQIGFRIDPGWGIWFGHLMFLCVLVIAPAGLFPKTRARPHDRAGDPQHPRQPGGGVVGAALVLVAASMPWWAESSWMRDFVEIAMLLHLRDDVEPARRLRRRHGLDRPAKRFFGLGGYTMLALGSFAGVNPFVAVPLAAVASALVAVPVSRVAFRLRAATSRSAPGSSPRCSGSRSRTSARSGGGSGTSLTALRGIDKATRESTTFWMALACVVASIALVYLFLRSKQGLALLAIRDNGSPPRPGHRG